MIIIISAFKLIGERCFVSNHFFLWFEGTVTGGGGGVEGGGWMEQLEWEVMKG